MWRAVRSISCVRITFSSVLVSGTNRISIRNDLSGEPYDLYTAASYGATRTQPGKVIQILCLDTTGADITP